MWRCIMMHGGYAALEYVSYGVLIGRHVGVIPIVHGYLLWAF